MLGLSVSGGAQSGDAGVALPPVFDPETGFGGDTDNCPEAPPTGRDAGATVLVDLLDDATKVAQEADEGTSFLALSVIPSRQDAVYTFYNDANETITDVESVAPFEDGAAERLSTRGRSQPGMPDTRAPDLEMLAIGPSAAMEAVRNDATGDIESFFAVSLLSEGCHLVWGVIAQTVSGEMLAARVSNTTGEVRWELSPFPALAPEPSDTP